MRSCDDSTKIQILQGDLRHLLKKLVDLDPSSSSSFRYSHPINNNTVAKASEGNDLDNDNADFINSSRVDEVQLMIPTVIVLYLLPEAIDKLESHLIQLLTKWSGSGSGNGSDTSRSQLRIVCIEYGLHTIQPTKSIEIPVYETGKTVTSSSCSNKNNSNGTNSGGISQTATTRRAGCRQGSGPKPGIWENSVSCARKSSCLVAAGEGRCSERYERAEGEAEIVRETASTRPSASSPSQYCCSGPRG